MTSYNKSVHVLRTSYSSYIIKEVPDAESLYARYKMIPPSVAPKEVQVLGKRIIAYKSITGTPARDADKVLAAANVMWYSEPGLMPLGNSHKSEYLMYCGIHLSDPIAGVLYATALTPVSYCHGDMTLENCIDTGTRIVFIDPGWPRGLNCKELDEAKVLQSVDGWHELKGYPKPKCTFEWRPVHWALLVTHYLRLLRHPELHTEVQLAFARKRIEEICETQLHIH